MAVEPPDTLVEGANLKWDWRPIITQGMLAIADGFLVTLIDESDLDKRRAETGVPPQLAGCHTAFLGDYTIEGHVPSEDNFRFLKEKPHACGLAIAGMPRAQLVWRRMVHALHHRRQVADLCSPLAGQHR